MNKRFFLIGFTMVALVSVVFFAMRPSEVRSADDASPEGCRKFIIDQMSVIHDEFRAHIFGARENNNGDIEGLTGGFASKSRTGILETKQRLTSELVAPAVESYRVLRCRTNAVCLAMKQSFDVDGGTDITVKQLGCADEPLVSAPVCSFTTTVMLPTDRLNLESECAGMTETSLSAERAVLKLAFSYDSGYRSMVQMAGMIDWFQGDFPDLVLGPIRDMVGMLGKLHQIPCFIGQCDRPDTSTLVRPTGS